MTIKERLEVLEEIKRIAKGVEDSSKKLMEIAEKQSAMSLKLSSMIE